MSDEDVLGIDDVRAAAKRLTGVAHHTPVVTSGTLDDLAGAEVFCKCENFQRVGAFKFRGAYHAISRLSREQLDRGVTAYSSGNHAQAVALASRLLGTRAVIVMPSDAPATSSSSGASTYSGCIGTIDHHVYRRSRRMRRGSNSGVAFTRPASSIGGARPAGMTSVIDPADTEHRHR